MANIKDRHIQCTLQNESTFQVSWIPAKFAVVGKVLKLKEEHGWENGWKVIERGQSQYTDNLIKHEKSYKKMREVSDI